MLTQKMRAVIVADPTLVNREIVMKYLTTLAVLLATTSLASAASQDNESFILQAGKKNTALVAQKNGDNGQATLQFGKGNQAITAQKTSGTDANNSRSEERRVGKECRS